MRLRKSLNIICYLVLPLSLILVSILFPYSSTFRLFGQLAEILLIYILFIKPIALVFNISWFRKQISLRRQLGVATFWLALFHSIMYLYDRELYSATNFLGFDNYLAYGFLAMIGMAILALISNNHSARFFGKNWKKIQYLAYPTLFLTLLHSSMAEEQIQNFIIISTIYIILKVLEWRGVRLRT